MRKLQTVGTIGEFMRPTELEKSEGTNVYKVIALGGKLFAVMAPRHALAATADATFGNIWSAIMNTVDWIVVGVFIFAGVSWMFGHRTKALELLIGGAAGYILARHAIDMRNFLKAL
ncbi:glycosyltransferase [Niallia circulans]|uniref:glycosyltransferase n=1 Tax=Niallia circulans TaxID=1397 RepID=UPI0015604211|nr:glycosyltransferase [Niallia circulans]NRG30683.1 glycosyltransferase [Niallia circulans]